MLKRAIDVVGSAAGLVVLSPVFLVIAAAIRIDSRGSVFFRQVRCGLAGKRFLIFKFRTMVTDVAASGLKITVGADRRITRVGHFLRRSKLDELPQLINVLKGEMSLVGPRPEVPEFMARYPRQQREEILSVVPGMTDFAALEFKDESAILARAADPEAAYLNEIMPRKYELYSRGKTDRLVCSVRQVRDRDRTA